MYIFTYYVGRSILTVSALEPHSFEEIKTEIISCLDLFNRSCRYSCEMIV